jgi:ABC-type bacteriocin/lantibiotic exporter with double-glycine peptidase domain
MNTIRKILLLMTKAERHRGQFILFLLTIMALLETLGVASVMPFLVVLSDPGLIEENAILSRLYNFSLSHLINSEDQFLFLLGVCSFVVVILSSIYKMYTFYKMYDYLEMLRHSIASRLTKSYLDQPYAFFLGKDSSDISKAVLSEVDTVIATVVRPGYIMLSNVFVLIAIVGLLFIANPVLLLITGCILGVLYFGLYYRLRVYVRNLGEQRLTANKSRFAVLNEALNNIKFVKFYSRESDYIAKFRVQSRVFASSVAKFATLNQIPKYLVEAVAFGGLISLVLVLLAFAGGLKSASLAAILPTIGLYAFAIYRLQPAVQAIYSGFSGLKYGEQAVEALLTDIQSIDQKMLGLEEGRTVDFKSSAHLQNLSFAYENDGGAIGVLDKIDIKILAGSKIGVVGKTGAGKTTLIDIIMGLLAPTSGNLTIDGVRVSEADMQSWRKNIGYVPQEVILNDASIEENIAYGVSKDQVDTDRVVKCAELAQLDDFISKNTEHGYLTFVGERGVRLSGGQRQRLGIARALYHNPAVLVFDEATSALDLDTEKAVMSSLNIIGEDRTVIMITHRLSTLENCDRIIELDSGKVIFDGSFSAFRSENFEITDADNKLD